MYWSFETKPKIVYRSCILKSRGSYGNSILMWISGNTILSDNQIKSDKIYTDKKIRIKPQNYAEKKLPEKVSKLHR